MACCAAARSAPTPVGSVGRTGIAKQIRADGIVATRAAVLDDVVCNTRYHGGPDKALYAYGEEDASWWAAQLGRPVPPGLFGENVHVRGIDMRGALIGERWRIGAEVEVEVTMPRIPCVTFQHHMGEERWLKRFTEGGRPGTYLRVHRGGPIRPGDSVAILHRPQHGVTVSRWFTDARPADAIALLCAEEDEGMRLAPFLVPHLRRAAGRA